MNERLLDGLNDEQRRAVEYCQGPQLVIAGAGSGKTRVLTYKIAYLLEQGLAPWNILALTFTNKAAREMRERIGALVGERRARYLVMGTFHSIFARILRTEAERIGFTAGLTIYDEADSRSLLKSIVKEMGLSDKVYKPSVVLNRISMAKNHLVTAEMYAADSSATLRDRKTGMPSIAQIFLAYSARCRRANAMDFDDLLLYTYLLFRDNDDVRGKYAEQFRFILVDEYQDTNTAQQKIVYQLTMPSATGGEAVEPPKICVVGDDAQSIYAFRGANIDNILDFRTLFPGTKLFKLERNYRSTQRIVQAANSLIRHNQRQIHKDVYSCNAEGERVVIKPAYSDKEEALIVCKEIQRLISDDRRSGCRDHGALDYDAFAILYRTNAQSRSFEEVMRKEDIPYRIYGGLSFYQRKEIKDVIAYFRLAVNPDDEEALKRVINYPARGIGNTTVGKIAAAATHDGVSLWTVVSDAGHRLPDLSRGAAAKLTTFRDMVMTFIAEAATADAYTLGSRIIASAGIKADLYADKSPEAVTRQENLEELVGGLQDFVESRREEGRADAVTLGDYLQEVSLLTDRDSDDGEDVPRVSLMTVHSAKGLEFPVVFVVGMEDNIFPGAMAIDSPRELEEERRLFYVAITRAERHCVLTFAKSRFRYGRLEFGTPSRFLRDIDASLVKVEMPDADTGIAGRGTRRVVYGSATVPRSNVVPGGDSRRWASLGRSGGGKTPVSAPRSAETAPPASPVSAGMTIEHDRFGIGEVLSVEGTGENAKARVRFRNTGEKQLLLKFARFKVVE